MKKIQKLIKRLKNWLITKLGGYTLPMSEFKIYRPVPIELYATLKNVRRGYIPEGKIEEHLVHMIAEEIKNKKLYELHSCKDIITGELSFRMKVLAVEPLKGV